MDRFPPQGLKSSIRFSKAERPDATARPMFSTPGRDSTWTSCGLRRIPVLPLHKFCGNGVGGHSEPEARANGFRAEPTAFLSFEISKGRTMKIIKLEEKW